MDGGFEYKEWMDRNPKNEKLEPCLSKFLSELDMTGPSFDDLLELLDIFAVKQLCLSLGLDTI